jgi:pyridoxamine 5'-phosphate oxidase-like protein
MPIAQKLVLPQDYGQTTKTLAWEGVRAQLEQAKQYWLATNRADGSPHVVPVDGLWVDDVWYYGGSPETIHVQMVRANPHVTMHLPDPWKVVVVQGEVRVSKPSPELASGSPISRTTSTPSTASSLRQAPTPSQGRCTRGGQSRGRRSLRMRPGSHLPNECRRAMRCRRAMAIKTGLLRWLRRRPSSETASMRIHRHRPTPAPRSAFAGYRFPPDVALSLPA